ncbi:glycosyl hydrolase [Coniochaeta sp. PMI_546]|nr:glycosyl hydrolase [Coniochaeta sp. PMI_546]
MASVRRSRLVFTATVIFALFVFLHYGPIRQAVSPSTPYVQPASFTKPVIQFKKSSIDWESYPTYYPAQSVTKLPTGKAQQLPRVQYQFKKSKHDAIAVKRALAVREAFIRSWKDYKDHAWLHDELLPLSGGFKDPFGGWAATLVDSLDTLWIMGLKDEFYAAAAAAVAIDFGNTTGGTTSINLFETTIRHLGGLLSAYDLSGEPALLKKAKELGDLLYIAFDTPNRIPGFWLNFEDARAGRQLAGTHDPSASPTSLSLEFTRLSQLTRDDKYFDAITRVSKFLERTQEESKLPGMWPAMINFQQEHVRGDNSFALGALADSLYEYLPKMYVLLGGRQGAESYKKMYRRAMEVVEEHILFRPMLPKSEDILFAGTTFVNDDGGIQLVPEGQHLHCFLGGMFAIAGKIFNDQDHVSIGERLARGCAWVYRSFPTGLAPEYFSLLECPSLKPCSWDESLWDKEGNKNLTKGFRHARDPRYQLRPEAIESIFILYRITGQEDLRDIAWTMFESIMAETKAPFGHAAVKDVTVSPAEKEDSMESFWLAETLKYFYLIFSPAELISLDDYVLSTEAHPFKRT